MKDIIGFGFMVIKPGEHPALVKSIEIVIKSVEDDDGWVGWIGDNKELGIHASTSSRLFPRWKWYNWHKLRQEIIVDIDFMIDSYLVQDCHKMSEDLRKCVDILKGYVDPSKRTDKHHWEDVIVEQ
jgi:hypothetical protein